MIHFNVFHPRSEAAMGKRRGHGEGAISQRESDGLWCTSVDLRMINGKRWRKVIYGKTRKEVAEKLKEAMDSGEQRRTRRLWLQRWRHERPNARSPDLAFGLLKP